MSGVLYANSAAQALATSLTSLYQFNSRECLLVPHRSMLAPDSSGDPRYLLHTGRLLDDLAGAYDATTVLMERAATLLEATGTSRYHIPLASIPSLHPEQRTPYLIHYETPAMRTARLLTRYKEAAPPGKAIVDLPPLLQTSLETRDTELHLAQQRRLSNSANFLSHGLSLFLSTQLEGVISELVIGLRLEGLRAAITQRDRVVLTEEGPGVLDTCVLSFSNRSYLERMLGRGPLSSRLGIAYSPAPFGPENLQDMLTITEQMYAADPDLFREGFALSDSRVETYQLHFNIPGQIIATDRQGHRVDARQLSLRSEVPDFSIRSIAGLAPTLSLFSLLWSDVDVKMELNRPHWMESAVTHSFADYFDLMEAAIRLELKIFDEMDPRDRRNLLETEIARLNDDDSDDKKWLN